MENEKWKLGPVEWATVTKYLGPPGFFMRLEESGEEAFMDITSYADDPVCSNPAYWPSIGERIRVRRYPRDREQIRVTGCMSRVEEGLRYGYPSEALGLPIGIGPVELGRVIEHREKDVLVRLEDSGRVGVIAEQGLMFESARRVHKHFPAFDIDERFRRYWPKVGSRIQVRRLGVWPNGEIRLGIGQMLYISTAPRIQSRHRRAAGEYVTEYTRTLTPEVVRRVRAITDAISLRCWEQAEALTSDNRLDWEQVDAFMTSYTYTFRDSSLSPAGVVGGPTVPDEFIRDMFAAPLQDSGDWVDCLLWTVMERPSDVDISLKIIPNPSYPDGLKASLVRIRAIGFRYRGRYDVRPRPATPAWTLPA